MVQTQIENIRKYAPLYFQPTRKRLMTREEGNRAFCLEETLKPPLFLQFPSDGMANIESNHMPLVHYIGPLTAEKVTLFHYDIGPFCASARENNPIRGITG